MLQLVLIIFSVLCVCIIIFAILYVLYINLLSRQRQSVKITTLSNYIFMVYPLLPGQDIPKEWLIPSQIKNTLTYFWYSENMTGSLIKEIFPELANCNASPFFNGFSREDILNEKTIQLGELQASTNVCCNAFCGAGGWSTTTGVYINIHDPSVLGRNVKGVESNSIVEVTNTCCNFEPAGQWFNVLRGSGIFYDVGKTLIATNKLNALLQMGVTAEKIANKWPDFSWNGWGSNSTSWLVEKELIQQKFGISTLPDLITAVSNGSGPSPIDIVSNCPIVDIFVFSTAIENGYDSIQYTAAAYSGDWSYEIQDTRQLNFADMCKKGILSLRNPLDLTEISPCISNYTGNPGSDRPMLYCENQISATIIPKN